MARFVAAGISALALVFCSPAAAASHMGTAHDSTAILAFVSAQYFHGVPYERAHSFGPTAITLLERFLERPELRARRHNICSTIGYIGAPEGFPVLHRVVWSRFHGEIDEDDFAAVRAAQSSMGFLAAASPEAVHYLMKGVVPDYWGTLPYHRREVPEASTRRTMAELSIAALGYSGREDAKQFLATLRTRPPFPNAEFHIDSALRSIAEVQAKGHAQFVADYRRRVWGDAR